MNIPDDSYYLAEPEGEDECDGENWKQCWCEKCQDKRADYADYRYEMQKDSLAMIFFLGVPK